MSTLKLTVIAIACLTATAATARDDVSFTFSRADLSSSIAVKALYERMDRTAKAACTTPGARPLDMRSRDNACHAQLITNFVEQVDSPALTTVHEDHHSAERIARVD